MAVLYDAQEASLSELVQVIQHEIGLEYFGGVEETDRVGRSRDVHLVAQYLNRIREGQLARLLDMRQAAALSLLRLQPLADGEGSSTASWKPLL